MWKPLHNPDKSFGGGLHYRDLEGKSLNEVATAFHERHKAWYIEPIKLLASQKDSKRPHGFVMTAISCILIDILSQYHVGSEKHQENDYVKYVEGLDPLFNQKIDPAIISFRFKDRLKKGPTEEIKHLAYAFYHGFRSGIVHGGRILEYGRISGPQVAPKIIQIRKWGEKSENQEVAVSPELLFECVENRFMDYIKALTEGNNLKLRQNFAKKFGLDFGVSLKT